MESGGKALYFIRTLLVEAVPTHTKAKNKDKTKNLKECRVSCFNEFSSLIRLIIYHNLSEFDSLLILSLRIEA
jgi:hypothetical protein